MCASRMISPSAIGWVCTGAGVRRGTAFRSPTFKALNGVHPSSVRNEELAAASVSRPATPAGKIVILAVLFDSAVPIVSQFGDALAGKIIVDITNPFNASFTGLAIPADTSIAQMVAKAAPASADVVKAFNTLFRDVLAAGGRLDVFMAGDDAQAKASLSAFIESLGLRPRDTGDLSMAHWLEGAGLLSVGLGRHGAGNYNFSLGVNFG
jgi:predicted dinucleotide-binding enzyme